LSQSCATIRFVRARVAASSACGRRSARRAWAGIGVFKADSEIGVVLNAGPPCFFVGFLPEPMPGQTIMNAEEIQFLAARNLFRAD
jgi:hypothetical protein